MRAVVIGSGLGGLAVAIRLAAAGHDVTVFEKRDRIGGRADRYDIDGFRFDAGPTILTAPHLFDELFALAGERLADRVNLVALDPFYRVFDGEGGHLDLGASEGALAAQVAARSPGDTAGLAHLMGRIGRIFDAFHPYTERPMLHFGVMMRMLPYLLANRAGLSVQRLVDHAVRDPFLRRALAFHPMLIGGHPSHTPALYALIVEFERRWGVHYARGGTAALVDALGGLLARLGGRVVTGAEVTRIRVERGRATGVELADGTVQAADVVVSDADPGHTAGQLLRRAPLAAPTRLRHRLAAPSMSLHVLYLGADRTWPGSPLAHHSLLLGGGAPALDRVFPTPGRRTDRIAGIDDLFVYVHVPTRTDPSVAPPGCENLYVLVAAPPLTRRSGSADAEGRRIRDLVVDALDERYLPGLRDHLVVEHAVGPEHFRDALNTPRGAAFSLRPTLLQSGWFRPQGRVLGIRDLYQVGAGTHPGAGIPAVLASAAIAARLVGERWPAVLVADPVATDVAAAPGTATLPMPEPETEPMREARR